MSSLRVMVIRYDDKIITEMTMDDFMMRLTGRFLREMPPLRRMAFMSSHTRDAQMAAALNDAWKALRTDLFTVGFKLSTWVDE